MDSQVAASRGKHTKPIFHITAGSPLPSVAPITHHATSRMTTYTLLASHARVNSRGCIQGAAFPNLHVRICSTHTRCNLRCWPTQGHHSCLVQTRQDEGMTTQFQISMVDSLVRLPFCVWSHSDLSSRYTHSYVHTTACHVMSCHTCTPTVTM